MTDPRPRSFIDRILEIDPEHALTEYTWRDEDCAGHFPGNPVVPGVKMLEMAAQTAAAWGLHLRGAEKDRREPFFTGADRVVFKKSVRPGQTVACRAEFGKGGSFRDGRMVADVELRFQGGAQDGETIAAGTISGVWAPENSEELS